jgi:pimeloyl-ACP methyl ester carboxylesterase
MSVDGRPRLDYDLSIAHNFPSTEDIKSIGTPPQWELFAAANALPVAILRGEHSDLLSSATVAAMQDANPQLDATTVAGRGHAPFLDEPESWAAINRWLARVDAGA